MSIVVVSNLPALHSLQKEGYPIEGVPKEEVYKNSDLRILIVNLMVTKETTEKQLLRILANQDQRIGVDFLYMTSHNSKHTSREYLEEYYYGLDEIKNRDYDGVILTGAPVEELEFTEVSYYEELQEVLDYTNKHARSVYHICWSAQLVLSEDYQIKREFLPQKAFGVIGYKTTEEDHFLLQSISNEISIPQSRLSRMNPNQIEKSSELMILSYNENYGPDLIVDKNKHRVFQIGHIEYDATTLAEEYFRDVKLGKEIAVPENYFPENKPHLEPVNYWHQQGKQVFQNWLTYLQNINLYTEEHVLNK